MVVSACFLGSGNTNCFSSMQRHTGYLVATSEAQASQAVVFVLRDRNRAHAKLLFSLYFFLSGCLVQRGSLFFIPYLFSPHRLSTPEPIPSSCHFYFFRSFFLTFFGRHRRLLLLRNVSTRSETHTYATRFGRSLGQTRRLCKLCLCKLCMLHCDGVSLAYLCSSQ